MTAKRYTPLLLLLPALAQAEITRMQVQLTPDEPAYWRTQSIVATVNTDATAPEYQFSLERVGQATSPVLTSNWGTVNRFEFDMQPVNVLPGEYRLRVAVREAANPREVMSKIEVFRVRSQLDGETEYVRQQKLLAGRYEQAKTQVQNTLINVRRKLSAGQDVTVDCALFASSSALIGGLLNPRGLPGPEGLPAFSGAPDDSTGTIGVMVTPPSYCHTTEGWNDAEVVLQLPWYGDLGAAERTLSFTDAFAKGSGDAQRLTEMRKVQQRFAEASSTLRKHFRLVMDKQAAGFDVTTECGYSTSAESLIENVLNSHGLPAPGGGNAFAEGMGDDVRGVIGVTVVNGCTDPSNWYGVAFELNLPSYHDLGSQSVTIGYDDLVNQNSPAGQRAMLQVQSSFAKGITDLRTMFRRVKAMQRDGLDVASECAAAESGSTLILNVLNPEEHRAPGGGNAFTDSHGGDAGLGAVGVIANRGCADPQDWSGVSFTFHLPAYWALTPREVTVSYSD